MSAFLGPIHYWLFNKILLIEDRAFAIATYLQNNNSAEIANGKIEEYGERMSGTDLAELVGNNPIHNFLYSLISKVEVFEAGLVEAAGDKYDDILKVIENHGKKSAEQAIASKGGEKPCDLESLYQYINDCQLEGMPCDPSAEVEMLDGAMSYNHRVCNHIPNWEYTNCSVSKMCGIHNAWLKGFVSGLSDSATYTVENTLANSSSGCSARIEM